MYRSIIEYHTMLILIIRSFIRDYLEKFVNKFWKMIRVYIIFKALDEKKPIAAKCNNKCHTKIIFDWLRSSFLSNFAPFLNLVFLKLILNSSTKITCFPEETSFIRSNDALKNFVTFGASYLCFALSAFL